MIRVPLALLQTALPGARLLGRRDAWVERLTADSRQVRPQDLFGCVRGRNADGHQFAVEAVRRGATVLLTDRAVPGVDLQQVAVLRVGCVARALADLAPAFYGHPSHGLKMIGVTGTSGKTTVTHLLRAILEQAGWPTGLIGTIRNEFAGRVWATSNTTPMAWDLQALLHEMQAAGCRAVVMEVSSHALVEGRVAGCEFDAALFTNLSSEHMDLHRTMAAYARAKGLLFRQLARSVSKPGPRFALVNADDPYARSLQRAARPAVVRTFALDHAADHRALDLKLSASGSRFTLATPGGQVPVRMKLLGRDNVQNALAAAAAAQALGIGLKPIQRGLQQVRSVAGRVERVPGSQPFTVLVDYAHKTDALVQVLQSVREFTRGRVIVVFGCGGDRDPTKRAPMGEAAARLADAIFLTSDNPRNEDPQTILQEILVGVRRAVTPEKTVHVEVDRGQAIRQALRSARVNDTVILAGKGHEDYQLIGPARRPFNDRQVAESELKRLARRGAWKA